MCLEPRWSRPQRSPTSPPWLIERSRRSPRRARVSTPAVAIRDCGRLVRRPRRPIVRPSFPRPSGRRRAHRCNRTRLGSTARGDPYAHSGRRPSGNPERRGHDQRTHPRQRGSGGRRAPVPHHAAGRHPPRHSLSWRTRLADRQRGGVMDIVAGRPGATQSKIGGPRCRR